jgi:phosphopantothenoylcysteine decarboxylase/phosphopantothenate--cysteine ligase
MKKIQKNILISTGPTRVYIDPVRYISNISSGKMGLAFINACLERQANLRVVSGKVDFLYPQNVKLQVFDVETNQQMLENLEQNFDWADVFISISAVVDFEPIITHKQKIKKNNNDSNSKFCLELKNSVDILKTLSSRKKANQIIIGFALETEDLIENAKHKLETKKLDFIIANKLEESMGLDTAKVFLIDKLGKIKQFDTKNKQDLAGEILDFIF